MASRYREEGTVGQRARAIELLRVLRREVGPLLSAERRLARAAALGSVCDVARRGDERLTLETEQDAWHTWRVHRTVRAEVLRAICVREDAHLLVHLWGVRLLNAHITGRINLDGAVVPYDLGLAGCAFDEPITAYGARVRTLDLQGSRVPGIEADRLQATGSVFLHSGFHATGEVRLSGARLGGDLACQGGRFDNKGGDALNADGLEAGGVVSLRGGFHATGGVRLLGARIGGNLDCTQGSFDNNGGDAIVADGLETGGSVFFRGGFHATGEVALLSARLGGDLSCTGGHFDNDGGTALDADGARVEGTLFLRGGNFRGELNFTRSRIGYLNDKPKELVRGRLAWPNEIILDDCRYDAIHTASPLDARRRLAWLANHDRTMAKYLPAGMPPDPWPYRWLASVLRKQGHERDADAVLERLGWRRLWPLFLQRLRGGGFWRWAAVPYCAMSLFYGVIVGHGYARFRPLLWLVGFWVAGVVIFSQDGGRHMQPTQGLVLRDWTQARELGWDGSPMRPDELAVWMEARAVQGDEGAGDDAADATQRERVIESIEASAEHLRWVASYPKFSPWVYSMDAFLPLVDFHQEEYWTPSSNWWAKDFYLPMHILMGWIVATLFAASFTKLARHE